eukprot:802073-Alexandrium_andersonii.AAC.1
MPAGLATAQAACAAQAHRNHAKTACATVSTAPVSHNAGCPQAELSLAQAPLLPHSNDEATTDEHSARTNLRSGLLPTASAVQLSTGFQTRSPPRLLRDGRCDTACQAFATA